MKISPFVVGSGRASQAIQKSLAMIGIQYPVFEIAPSEVLTRGSPLAGIGKKTENPILVIANPPGLHADLILEAEAAGFKAALVEKPACVSLEQVEKLSKVKFPVAVCHGYRQMWGPQTLKVLAGQGEMGEIISVEGKYWQSSTAQRALFSEKPESWKNNPAMSGEADTLLDLATHWVDAAIYILNEDPLGAQLWQSYANAETAHRDSHLHLGLEFSKNKRAFTSVSKTVHGATNDFELTVIGTQRSATWHFLNPDEIQLGQGARKILLRRGSSNLGSQHAAFHGLGWLEGYSEIIYQLLKCLKDNSAPTYPTLGESLKMLKLLLSLKKD